jgi:gamma-tubulin complex component 2
MIQDPFSEFFVLDTDNGSAAVEEGNDNYWENRYKLEPAKCPIFLKKVDHEILKAGKYLNVIRQCGKDICMTAVSVEKYGVEMEDSLVY